jgi:hypothetical protein
MHPILEEHGNAMTLLRYLIGSAHSLNWKHSSEFINTLTEGLLSSPSHISVIIQP